MTTILIIAMVLLSLQYLVFFIILGMDSTERDREYKLINTKSRFISWVIPFGYVITIVYHIINLWHSFEDD